MSRNIRRRLVWAAALVLAGACLWLAARNVSPDGLREAIGRAQPVLLALAVLTVPINLAAKSLRWRLLLPQANRPPAGDAVAMVAAGILLNILAPVRAGDLARAALVTRTHRATAASALLSVALEKAFESLVMLLSVAMLLVVMPLPDWLARPALAGAALLALALAALLAAWALGRVRTPNAVRWRLAPPGSWAERQAHSLAEAASLVREPRRLAAVLGWSAAGWAAAVATNALILQAMGIDAPVWASVLVLVATQVGVAVAPVAPGQVGVFHYLAMLSLSAFGVRQDAALAYAIVLHLAAYVPMVILGAAGAARLGLSWTGLVTSPETLQQVRMPEAPRLGDATHG